MSKRSKLDNPVIKKKVVKKLAVGEKQTDVGKDVGLSQSQISRFANRQDIQAFIEKEQKKLLEVVPDAVENVKGLVKEFKDIPKNENKRRELSYKANQDVLKSVGLLSTPVQSQTFVNLYQQQNNTILSPVILKLLEAQRDEMQEILESEGISENEA